MFNCYDSDTCNVQPAVLPVNEGFTKENTFFLIHLMCHLELDGGGPAKSLNDLNRRLRLGTKTKKLLWE